MNGDSRSPTITVDSSPTTTTTTGGGGDITVTPSRLATATASAIPAGRHRGGADHGRSNSNNSNSNNKAWNPVITALAASSAISLQITGISLCQSFITVQAKPGELLAIVRTSLQEAQTETGMGILWNIGNFYALGAYSEDDVDFMWKLSRVFAAVSLTMGGIATITAWATTVWSPSFRWTPFSCTCAPAGSIWTLIAATSSMAALLQVPTFLILEAYPCTDFIQQQTCHLSLGSYLVMASVVAWIIVTALTQLLDPPEWARNLEQWRSNIVPPKKKKKNNINNPATGESTQQDDEEEEVDLSGEDDNIFNQMEEGEISGIQSEDDGSQDPIFSPRPRQDHHRRICLVSSSAQSQASSTTSSSFWDGLLLPWRRSSSWSSSASRKPWQRCVKSSSSSTLNGAAGASPSQQSHRIVQRFSYASALPHNNNNSHTYTLRGRQLNDSGVGKNLVESSMEEAVESSYEQESTITFESPTSARRQQRPTNWAMLAQASTQARGLVDQEQQQRHVVEQKGQQDQRTPPQGGHRHNDYPIHVLHGYSEWDKPEGIVPVEESLTASSFRTSSSGRNSPITGDESILDMEDAKHDVDDATSSSSSVAESSQQGSSAVNSQDEEKVKAVAVSGVPIYKALLAEDKKRQEVSMDDSQQQQQHPTSLLLSGVDADEEHDELEEKNIPSSPSSGGGTEDPFFSELPDAANNSTIHNTSSSVDGGGGGGGYNFLDITSNTNMTNNTKNNTTTNRFLGVGLLRVRAASFRMRGSVAYYPFQNDDDVDDDDYDFELNQAMDSSNYSRGPPISEVEIYKLPNDVETGGADGSVSEDSILDTFHPVSSSSDHELLQTWNDLFDFDVPYHASLEDYRQESSVSLVEENVSSSDESNRLKSTSVVQEEIDHTDSDALDVDGRQQHQHQPGRGKTTEHDEADRIGGDTSYSSDSDNNSNLRDLKRRQMIAAVIRRTNGGSSGGGVTLRPRRQHRRGRHTTSDSVSSATSLLSFTIEEETAMDLMEEGGSDIDGNGDHYDYDDDKIVDCARRVKNSIPLFRTRSLPTINCDGDVSGNTQPVHHSVTSLPRVRMVNEQYRVHLVQSQTGKDPKQKQQQNNEDHIPDEDIPISMQRRRSRSLEVDPMKSKRRTSSRSLSPDRSVQSFTSNSNKKIWRTDREARSAMHNVPVISLSESSDDDSAKAPSSSPNQVRLSRIQRLQREREQQQQQQPKDLPVVRQNPPLASTVTMDDATDASPSEIVDDTTIETAEPMPHHDQKHLLLHCALTPPRRGSSSICSSRSDGDLDDSGGTLDTMEVSLAQLQREDEMEYGPDENSI